MTNDEARMTMNAHIGHTDFVIRVFSRRFLFSMFFARIIVHKLNPHFALLQLLRIDLQFVHIPRAGRRLDALAVELEAAGVTGTLKYLTIGGIADEAAGVWTNRVEAKDLLADAPQINRANRLVRLAVPRIGQVGD